MNRVSLGAFESTAAVLQPGAVCTHPVSVTRSATFGGSGCAVPGVGLPLAGFPPICAAAPAVNAATSASTPPTWSRAIN
jgi:hypothetical protein